MSDRLLVVGDVMLDRDVIGEANRLSPEQPVPVLEERSARSAPGGAALAAALLRRDGHAVTLLTALGDDAAGAELSELLAAAGVELVDVGLQGATPEKVRLRAQTQMLCRLDRGGGGRAGSVGRSRADSLVGDASAVLVADYGGGMAADPHLRVALGRARVVVWDPHPRGAPPVQAVALATPNDREAEGFAGAVAEPAELAGRLRRRWRADAVCVTRGERGAVLVSRGRPPLTIPVRRVHGDPCGAGDRFAATATALLAQGVDVEDAVTTACAEASSYVGDGGWHAPGSSHGRCDDPVGLTERVHAEGGVVVATGGCFDLLHAGHVAMLEAARRLGDALVVCLNSDRSVRRLKGADRPLVGEDDRAAVLRSLACVDAVVLFDDDTPAESLRRLRPDVFVKGADYEPERLPEARVMAELGGRVATVPYVAGLSTSALIERASVRAG